jgi:hypothetical protein
MLCCLGLKSKAEISAVPTGLPVDVVWIDAKVWMKSDEKKLMPCSLGLKSKAEIWAVPTGLPVDVVWIDAKVWINAMRKISPYSLGLKSKAEISAVPMGLRGTNVTWLLFFEWLALQVSVRLGAVKELRLFTRTGLGKMQKFKIVNPSVPSVFFCSVGSVVERCAKNAL